jgi:hypothetical protein
LFQLDVNATGTVWSNHRGMPLYHKKSKQSLLQTTVVYHYATRNQNKVSNKPPWYTTRNQNKVSNKPPWYTTMPQEIKTKSLTNHRGIPLYHKKSKQSLLQTTVVYHYTTRNQNKVSNKPPWYTTMPQEIKTKSLTNHHGIPLCHKKSKQSL